MQILKLAPLALISILFASCGAPSEGPQTQLFSGDYHMYCSGEITSTSSGKSARFDNRSIKSYSASTDIAKDTDTVNKVLNRFENNCKNDGDRKGINTNLCSKITQNAKNVVFYAHTFIEGDTRLTYRCEPRK